MGAQFQSGNKSRHGRHRRMMSDINVTPLVDVMLVLLIIFMVTAPMLTAGVTVDLPESAAEPLPGQDEPLAVSIDAAGDVFIQKTKVDLDELTPKLLAITNAKKDTRIFVRGDQAIDYGRVMWVMGKIHSAGFTKVALVTQPVQ